MIYLVRISRKLVTEGLTLGWKMKAINVIEGIPEGCELIAANIEANGALVLSFLKNDDKENNHKVFDQPISIETICSRESER